MSFRTHHSALRSSPTKGIGAAIANKLAHDGMQVLMGEIKSPDSRRRVKRKKPLSVRGMSAAPLLNVGDAGSVAKAFEAIDRQ